MKKNVCIYMCIRSKVAQSCPTLCDPMDCSLPVPSVPGIFQAIVLKWLAISFSRGSSQPRDQIQVSCIGGGFFTSQATREAQEYWSGQPIPFTANLTNQPRNGTWVSCIAGGLFTSKITIFVCTKEPMEVAEICFPT